MNFSCFNGEWRDNAGVPIPVFPIQGSREKVVPKVVAEEAYKEYSDRFGKSQSLDRLGERGGFGATEIAILLYQRIKRIELQLEIK